LILIFQSPFISSSKNRAQRKIAHEVLIRKILLTFSRIHLEHRKIKGKDARDWGKGKWDLMRGHSLL
jgi:hypothetical protein